jgi:hypothetical protein
MDLVKRLDFLDNEQKLFELLVDARQEFATVERLLKLAQEQKARLGALTLAQ